VLTSRSRFSPLSSQDHSEKLNLQRFPLNINEALYSELLLKRMQNISLIYNCVCLFHLSVSLSADPLPSVASSTFVHTEHVLRTSFTRPRPLSRCCLSCSAVSRQTPGRCSPLARPCSLFAASIFHMLCLAVSAAWTVLARSRCRLFGVAAFFCAYSCSCGDIFTGRKNKRLWLL